MALVSLIDRERQVHKARIGVSSPQLPRALSVCGHTILGSEPLVIADALADERFADNPLVTGPPHIRFYAGIPLPVADGRAIGALCIMDTRPRALDDAARASLQRLARIARIYLQHCYDQGGKTP
jgi:GAF domain-containing protein